MNVTKEDVILAIDLGGTQLRAALIDASGQILSREATRTDVVGGPDAVIEQIAALSQRLLSARPSSKIICAGISCPGPLDTHEGRTFNLATLPGYDGFPFASRARERLGVPVVLEHDGHAAAYGEWKQGAGRGFDDFIYLTVSTGLGGGAVVNGRLLRGAGGMAAHVGHMTVVPDGPLCGCGNRGCWELFASGTSFLARVRQRADIDHWLGLKEFGREFKSEDVFNAARKGDLFADEMIKIEGEWLGLGIVSILHLFNPKRIVIGGGMSANFDLLLPGIKAYIDKNAMAPFRNISIVKAALGDNAGLVGVSFLAKENSHRKGL